MKFEWLRCDSAPEGRQKQIAVASGLTPLEDAPPFDASRVVDDYDLLRRPFYEPWSFADYTPSRAGTLTDLRKRASLQEMVRSKRLDDSLGAKIMLLLDAVDRAYDEARASQSALFNSDALSEAALYGALSDLFLDVGLQIDRAVDLLLERPAIRPGRAGRCHACEGTGSRPTGRQ